VEHDGLGEIIARRGKLLCKMKKFSIIGVNAKNDANGNPRRGWIVLYPADEMISPLVPDHLAPSRSMIAFVEEGYEGRGAFKKVFADEEAALMSYVASSCLVLSITPGQYLKLVKEGRALASRVAKNRQSRSVGKMGKY